MGPFRDRKERHNLAFAGRPLFHCCTMAADGRGGPGKAGLVLLCLLGTAACHCRLVSTDCARGDTSCRPELFLLGAYQIHRLYWSDATGVYAFAQNPDTGALTQIGTLSTLACSENVARHPTQPVLYCLGPVGGVDVIATIRIHHGIMTVAQTQSLPDATFAGLYVHPTGDFLVVGRGTGQELWVYSIDGTGTTLTHAYTSASGVGGAASAFTRGGAYFYSRQSGGNLFEFSFSSTALTQTNTFAPGDNTWVFVETRDSRYLLGSTNANSYFRFDVSGGTASNFTPSSKIAGLPFVTTLLHDVSVDGRFILYMAGSNAGTFQYDAATGGLTQVSNIAGPSGTIRASPEGRFAYSTNSTQYDVYTIDGDGRLNRTADSPVTTGYTGQSLPLFYSYWQI